MLERSKYKDNGYNVDGQHRDVITMHGEGKANIYICYKSSSATSWKKSYKELKNEQRNPECVKKNAKLTSTNLQHRQ